MKLTKIILKDFLTYDELEYDFQEKPLLVQGLNLTDKNQASNGSGKSAIQTGVEFAITSSNSRDVRDHELVTYGRPQAEVELTAECDVRKERIRIGWIIKVKGSNKLSIHILKTGNTEEEVSFSNVNDGKKFIMNWFAISREDLFSYFIINKSKFKSFFKSSNREKVELINRFSDASIVEGLEDIDTIEKEQEAAEHQSSIDSTNGKIELLQAEITKEQNRDFATEFEEAESELTEEIQDWEEEIDIEKAAIEAIEGTIKSIKKAIDDYEPAKAEIIERVAKYNDRIAKESKRYAPVEKKLKAANKAVEEFERTEWDEKRATYKELEVVQQEKLDEIGQEEEKLYEQDTQLKSFLKQLEVIMGGSVTCPNCDHEFVKEGDLEETKEKHAQGNALGKALMKREEILSEQADAVDGELDKLSKSLSEINKLEQEENESWNKLNDIVTDIKCELLDIKEDIAEIETQRDAQVRRGADMDQGKVNLENKITQNKNHITAHENSIKNIKSRIEGIKEQMKLLKPLDNKKRIKELKKDLKEFLDAYTMHQKNLDKTNDEIYEMNQWKNNFKQFRMHLANQSLEVIGYHCNRYLEGMGSDMRVEFEGYKTLANGNVKDEITAKVLRGVERTFSSFSGGEQGRLLFASILANRHMINTSHPYGGLDFLSIDEVFEGVDGLGLKHLISSAKTLGIAVMIITHVTDEMTSDDVMVIVKENGVSRIK